MFLLFLSLSLGADYEVMERKYGKPKVVFFHNRLIHKKPLSILQQLLSFERFEFIFVAYFQGLNYLIISCFSHKFSEHIPINWRGILKSQERFLFITYSSKKKLSHFLHKCSGLRDMKASLRPKFPEIRQISPNPICYFWVNYL